MRWIMRLDPRLTHCQPGVSSLSSSPRSFTLSAGHAELEDPNGARQPLGSKQRVHLGANWQTSS